MSLFDYIPFVGPLVGGAFDAIGQSKTNAANRQIAQETNASNQRIAQSQMDFQNQQTSTAWQRGVEDMKAAGINPIFAASQGGASSGSGASIGAVTGAPMQNTMRSAQQAINSAINTRVANAQLQNIKVDTQLKADQAGAALQDSFLKSTNAKLVNQQLKQMRLAQPGLSTESAIDKSKYGQFLRYVGRLNPFGHSAASLAKVLK